MSNRMLCKEELNPINVGRALEGGRKKGQNLQKSDTILPRGKGIVPHELLQVFETMLQKKPLHAVTERKEKSFLPKATRNVVCHLAGSVDLK